MHLATRPPTDTALKQLVTTDLHWETSTTTNIGVDFSLWRGRVAGAVELYQTHTTDLLLSDLLPTSIGFNSVTRNIGETQNKGYRGSAYRR